MKISVAMCTYNGERFLTEQLDSIASQSRLPDEIIVCDDCSSDSTVSIVEDFRRTAPFPLILIRNSDRAGSTRNFQNAISHCNGEFIALADQDDVWEKQKLEVLAQRLERDSALGAIFSNGTLIDDESHSLRNQLWESVSFEPKHESLGASEFRELLLRQDVVTGATLMFRSKLLPHILPIPGEWVHDAWIAWIAVLYASLAFTAEPLIRYRVHSGQQIGVGSQSPVERANKIREAGNAQYETVQRRFGVLRDRVAAIPVKDNETVLAELDSKIQHAYYQTALSQNRAMRAAQIVKAWPRYRRYTRGLVTAVRDLMA